MVIHMYIVTLCIGLPTEKSKTRSFENAAKIGWEHNYFVVDADTT